MHEKAGRKARFLVFGYLNAWQTAEGKASSILPAFVLPSVLLTKRTPGTPGGALPRNRVFHGFVFADPVPPHFY
jgi:hypothetical protein